MPEGSVTKRFEWASRKLYNHRRFSTRGENEWAGRRAALGTSLVLDGPGLRVEKGLGCTSLAKRKKLIWLNVLRLCKMHEERSGKKQARESGWNRKKRLAEVESGYVCKRKKGCLAKTLKLKNIEAEIIRCFELTLYQSRESRAKKKWLSADPVSPSVSIL